MGTDLPEVDVLFVEMRYGATCGTSAFTAGVCSVLDELGMTHDGVDEVPTTADIEAILRERKPKLVLSCPRFNSVNLLLAVDKFPSITFGYRTLSNWTMMAVHNEVALVLAWIEKTQASRNVWMLPNNPGILKSIAPMAMDRTLLFPNVYAGVFAPDSRRDGDLNDPVRIGIAGRPCWSKNMGATAVALKMVAIKRSIRAYLWSHAKVDPELTRHVQCFEVLSQDLSFMGWATDFQDQVVGVDIDIAMCPSLTESFGYVALEFMALGIPVVASPAIRFAPTRVIDESDPMELAWALNRMLSGYSAESAAALAAAHTVAATNREAACKTLQRLVS